jgi:hypothetical protein
MMQNTSHAVMSQRHEARSISRDQARAVGQKWYFTGSPCPRGHIAKRSVSNRDCRSCVEIRKSMRRAVNPEEARAKDRARYHADGDKKRAQMRTSRAAHIDDRREYDRRRYHESAKRKAAQFAQSLRWQRENKGQRNEITARRRSWIKRATPAWLTATDFEKIKSFYQEAASREGEWDVDHIVPLRGKTVCGLHVPSNLQIIPHSENRRKGNAF